MAKELSMNRLFIEESVQKVHKGENVQKLHSSDKQVNQVLATLGVDEDVQAEKLSMGLLGLQVVTNTTENNLSPCRKAEDMYNYGPVPLFLQVYPKEF